MTTEIATGFASNRLTPSWTQLRYHETQSKLWRTKARIVHVCAGRGSGKTVIARRRTVRYLKVRKPWPDPRYFYALPTFAQARRVGWQQLLMLIPPEWIKKKSESSLEIQTIFGSWLWVVGMDKPARVEGDQYDGCVLDESSDQKPGIFGRTVRPALTHRNGWCWRIGVPKRYGPGARDFKTAFQKGLRGEAGMESYTWPAWDILTPEEIAAARAETDAKDFNEQYGGVFVDAGGAAFHAYTEANNVRKVSYDSNQMVVVGCDFNVTPMAWTIGHVTPTPYGPAYSVFDEIWLTDTNTQRSLDTLWNRYSGHAGGWLFVGDATGRARKTAASQSDYKIILNDKRFKANVRFPSGNPIVRDRLASTNALLCNAAGEHRCFVDYNCTHLRDDLENRALLPDGNPDDADPMSGHITDALGYVIHKMFPMKVDSRGNVSSSTVSISG